MRRSRLQCRQRLTLRTSELSVAVDMKGGPWQQAHRSLCEPSVGCLHPARTVGSRVCLGHKKRQSLSAPSAASPSSEPVSQSSSLNASSPAVFSRTHLQAPNATRSR